MRNKINNYFDSLLLFGHLAIILSVFLFTSCHTSSINPDQMIGKTRNEVLLILYNDALRDQYSNEPFIIVRDFSHRNRESIINYRKIEDIKNNEKIMYYSNWGFRKRIYDIIPITMFIIPYETRCFLYFENDKVVKYDYSYYYE